MEDNTRKTEENNLSNKILLPVRSKHYLPYLGYEGRQLLDQMGTHFRP